MIRLSIVHRLSSQVGAYVRWSALSARSPAYEWPLAFRVGAAHPLRPPVRRGQRLTPGLVGAIGDLQGRVGRAQVGAVPCEVKQRVDDDEGVGAGAERVVIVPERKAIQIAGGDDDRLWGGGREHTRGELDRPPVVARVDLASGGGYEP